MAKGPDLQLHLIENGLGGEAVMDKVTMSALCHTVQKVVIE